MTNDKLGVILLSLSTVDVVILEIVMWVSLIKHTTSSNFFFYSIISLAAISIGLSLTARHLFNKDEKVKSIQPSKDH